MHPHTIRARTREARARGSRENKNVDTQKRTRGTSPDESGGEAGAHKQAAHTAKPAYHTAHHTTSAIGPCAPVAGPNPTGNPTVSPTDKQEADRTDEAKKPVHLAYSAKLREMLRLPLPGMACPNSFAFSPDGTWLAYLHDPEESLEQSLFALHIASGKTMRVLSPEQGGVTDDNASPAEQLRRERQRQRATGITRFSWIGKQSRLLLPIGNTISVIDEPGRQARPILAGGPAPILDPQPSPDGASLGYITEGELWVVPTAGGLSRRLTWDARPGIRVNGLAEFIAQEELQRSHGFWWSKDARWIAFTQVDEAEIPEYPIVHQGADDPACETHRYPFAGMSNASVRLGFVRMHDGAIFWSDLCLQNEGYLAAGSWHKNATFYAQVLDRRQQHIEVRAFTPDKTTLSKPSTSPLHTEAGFPSPPELSAPAPAVSPLPRAATPTSHHTPPLITSSIVLMERSETWINFHNAFRPLGQGRFLWASERSGFRHLEIWENGQPTPITTGDWEVTSVEAVDTQRGIAYYTSTQESPRERHFYAVSLAPAAGSTPQYRSTRLTTDAGIHTCTAHAAMIDSSHSTPGQFVDYWSSRVHPPTVALRSLSDGSLISTLHEPPHDLEHNRLDHKHLTPTPTPTSGTRPSPDTPSARDEPRHTENMAQHAAEHTLENELRPPEFLTITNRDGVLLHGALYRAAGEGPHPLLVDVYGGPHVQRVVDSWTVTVNRRAQHLRSKGVCVFVLDNQGSAHRGLDFEAALRHRMGSVEVDDQVDGVKWLVAQGIVDPARVAVSGWSYGGYLSLMCLARASDVFCAAVAGAPVTDWDGYDTGYTERYMGLPLENPTGYREASVLSHVGNIKGRLLLIHGMMDENVHFRHTARLIKTLTEAGIRYNLVLLPEDRHMPRKEAGRLYTERSILEFLEDALACGPLL